MDNLRFKLYCVRRTARQPQEFISISDHYVLCSIIGRWAAEERVICGKTIPAQCAVSAAVWVLHHDPRFWTDPWKFDPERFAPENR